MSVRSSLNLVRGLSAGLLLLPLLPAYAAPPAATPPAAPVAAASPTSAPASPAKPPAASPSAPAVAVTATATAPAAPTRPTATKVVEGLQKVYEGTANLRARFNQTISGPMGKRQASGAMLLKKPGKMRWDYEKPEKKLFVADGTMLWMYEPEDEQAFKQPLSSSQLPAQVSFLFGRGRLLDEFEVSYFDAEKLGEASDLVLKLVPKKATAQYKHLVFVVDPKTLMVKQTKLFDQQGGTNLMVFSAIETNLKAGIDDSRFSFTPPEGTKIINPN